MQMAARWRRPAAEFGDKQLAREQRATAATAAGLAQEKVSRLFGLAAVLFGLPKQSRKELDASKVAAGMVLGGSREVQPQCFATSLLPAGPSAALTVPTAPSLALLLLAS